VEERVEGYNNTWHPDVEVCEGDPCPGAPPEAVLLLHVGKSGPEILLWSQTHQTHQIGALIPASTGTHGDKFRENLEVVRFRDTLEGWLVYVLGLKWLC